jgi:flagellar hook-length control protein FliK
MTAVNGLPVQQTQTATPRAAKTAPEAAAASSAKNAVKDSPRTDEGQDFDSVFKQAASKAQPQQKPVNEDGLQPRRQRDARSKALLAEDVLPPEMLLTLVPQQPPVPLPFTGQMPFAGLTAAPNLAAGEVLAELPPPIFLAQGKTAPDVAPQQPGLSSTSADPLAAFATGFPALAEGLPAPLRPGIGPSPALQAEPASPAGAAAQQRSSSFLAMAENLSSTPQAGAQRAANAEISVALAAQAIALQTEGAELQGEQAMAPPEPIGDTPVVVTRQETVLAPPSLPPAVQQAADRIIAELAAPAEDVSSTEPSAFRRDGDGATRVLHIQLDPPELGMLTVKLSLRDNALTISVEAAEPAAARLLETDRERLTEMLRPAGYTTDSVTIQVAAPERSPTAFQALTASGGDNLGQPGSGGQAQPDAQRGQQSRRGNEEWTSSPARREEGENAAGPASARGDLYL